MLEIAKAARDLLKNLSFIVVISEEKIQKM